MFIGAGSITIGDIILSCPRADRMPNMGETRQRLQRTDLGLTTNDKYEQTSDGERRGEGDWDCVGRRRAMRGNYEKYYN